MILFQPISLALSSAHQTLLLGRHLSFEEAELLKHRSEAFLGNAERLIEVEEWDLAAFNLEQYCHLFLNYLLLVKTGNYLRTHSLRELIRRLQQYEPEVRSLIEEENRLLYITKLEDAYVMSRYIPRRYEKEEVLALHRFVKEVFKEVVSGL